MDNTHEEAKPLPRHTSYKRRMALIMFTGISTLMAVVWGLSDVGRLGEHWGELAGIFFTWLTAVLTAWALLWKKE